MKENEKTFNIEDFNDLTSYTPVIKTDEKEIEKQIKSIKKFSEFGFNPSENLKFHLENKISILDNVFRPGSEAFLELISEAKNFTELLSEDDKKIFENTDLGEFAMYEGEMVPLDIPFENIESLLEAEYKGKKVKLNYPKRNTGSGKKYYVYVRDPKTKNIKKVTFGDVRGGLSAKVSDPEARKRFAARHKCHLKKDKTKPGYWSCRANRYAHLCNGTTYPGYW